MKPLGFFELADPEQAPDVQFSLVPDWYDLKHYRRLAKYSERTGHKWVVFLSDPVVTVQTLISSMKRLEPILPHVVAVTAGEEHYEQALANVPPAADAHLLSEVDRVLESCERAHAAIAAVTDWPIVWITTVANEEKRFGAWWYRPIPNGTSFLALDAYVPTGSTFALAAEPIIKHAINTSPIPIVLIWPTFEAEGWEPVTAEAIAGYGKWGRHEKVMANWLFTWDSRGKGMKGLADMPEWHGAVMEALR